MEILPFTFETDKVRTFKDEFGNIWFVANDIFTILEIASKGGRSDSLA
jgi:prophage antirepressor-like protein